jgi:hypothetical protein
MADGEPTELSFKADKLLRVLDHNGVDFVVVGGIAGLVHGSAYPTYDLDVAYSRDRGNLERLAAALRELGVTLRGAPADLPFQFDAETLAKGANFTFDTPYGSFDILGDVAGVSDYQALRADAAVEEVEEIEVRIASLDHLIAMKRAANRTKDKLMVEEYIAMSNRQRQG